MGPKLYRALKSINTDNIVGGPLFVPLFQAPQMSQASLMQGCHKSSPFPHTQLYILIVYKESQKPLFQ